MRSRVFVELRVVDVASSSTTTLWEKAKLRNTCATPTKSTWKVFTRGADCKPYKTLDKIMSLPKPLTLPVVQTWAEDTFAEFREHGLVDNVEEIKHMNTNPYQGRTIWDLMRTVMTNAQAASVGAFKKPNVMM